MHNFLLPCTPNLTFSTHPNLATLSTSLNSATISTPLSSATSNGVPITQPTLPLLSKHPRLCKIHNQFPTPSRNHNRNL